MTLNQNELKQMFADFIEKEGMISQDTETNFTIIKTLVDHLDFLSIQKIVKENLGKWERTKLNIKRHRDESFSSTNNETYPGFIFIDQVEQLLNIKDPEIEFTIEDDFHCDFHGKFETYEQGIEELKRLLTIPYGTEPNIAPCMSHETCQVNWVLSKDVYYRKKHAYSAALAAIKVSKDSVVVEFGLD